MRIFALLFCMLMISCAQEDEDGWVAKYKEFVITKTELKAVIPKDLSGDDSLKFVNQYVENWIKNRVLISEKSDFLNEDELTKLEMKVAKYREDLTEVMIEDKLMLGFSDSVSDSELQKYYNEFPDSFILNDDIITYRLMEVPEDSASAYRKLLQKDEVAELKKKLTSNGYYHDFKADNWIETDKLKKSDLLPEKIRNQNLMSEDQIFSSSEQGKSVILQVLKTGKKDAPAPFDYIKPTIKNVVLNKRKLNLLTQKKNELYEKAIENDEIERK